MSNDVYGLKGEARGDYFHILCMKCNAPTMNEYLGKDPTMPYFKAKCPNCGDTFRYKLENLKWEGLPNEPTPRLGFFDEFEIE